MEANNKPNNRQRRHSLLGKWAAAAGIGLRHGPRRQEGGLARLAGDCPDYLQEERMKEETVSVVIPVYRSEASLPELVARIRSVLKKRGCAFEILFVNDGSPDQSWEIISKLAQAHPEVRGIHLSRNFGQHNALLCGIREARHDVIITMDDDLQHPPDELPTLLDRLSEGWDVVYGTPEEEQHGWLRDVASVGIKRILYTVLGISTARAVSAFRAFRAHLRHAFADYRSPYVSIDPMLSWGTTRFTAVPVRHEARRHGQSNYSFRKLVRHTLNLTTAFSTAPLRFATIFGFFASFLGLLLLGGVLTRYLLDGCPVAGFTFLASVIILFSGTQLLALGVIGEYMARMHIRLMERPSYVVRDQLPSRVLSGENPCILELPVRGCAATGSCDA
jgi:undecaprenyl-phosphate 4-deoxy-4-formamido-L-arabinose transferase